VISKAYVFSLTDEKQAKLYSWQILFLIRFYNIHLNLILQTFTRILKNKLKLVFRASCKMVTLIDQYFQKWPFYVSALVDSIYLQFFKNLFTKSASDSSWQRDKHMLQKVFLQ
jgi:hypothetical protein